MNPQEQKQQTVAEMIAAFEEAYGQQLTSQDRKSVEQAVGPAQRGESAIPAWLKEQQTMGPGMKRPGRDLMSRLKADDDARANAPTPARREAYAGTPQPQQHWSQSLPSDVMRNEHFDRAVRSGMDPVDAMRLTQYSGLPAKVLADPGAIAGNNVRRGIEEKDPLRVAAGAVPMALSAIPVAAAGRGLIGAGASTAENAFFGTIPRATGTTLGTGALAMYPDAARAGQDGGGGGQLTPTEILMLMAGGGAAAKLGWNGVKAGIGKGRAVLANRAEARTQAGYQQQLNDMAPAAGKLEDELAFLTRNAPSPPPRPVAVRRGSGEPAPITQADVDAMRERIDDLPGIIARERPRALDRFKARFDPLTPDSRLPSPNAFDDAIRQDPKFRPAYRDEVGVSGPGMRPPGAPLPGRPYVLREAGVAEGQAQQRATDVQSRAADRRRIQAETEMRDTTPDSSGLTPRAWREQIAYDAKIDDIAQRMVPAMERRRKAAIAAGASEGEASTDQMRNFATIFGILSRKKVGAGGKGAAAMADDEADKVVEAMRRNGYDFSPFASHRFQDRLERGQFGPMNEDAKRIWGAIKRTAPRPVEQPAQVPQVQRDPGAGTAW